MFLVRGIEECSFIFLLPIFSCDWKIFRMEANTRQDSGMATEGGWSLERVGKLALPPVCLSHVFARDHGEGKGS